MNLLHLTTKTVSARFFAAITIMSLVLSALPATFLFAASTGVGLSDAALTTDIDDAVFFTATASSDDTTFTAGTYVALDDAASGGTFYSGTISDSSCSATVDTDNEFAVTENKGICYANSTPGTYTITAQLLDGPAGAAIGTPATVEITVACTGQTNAAGVTNIQNDRTGDYFDTLEDALADCDTSDGDIIDLLGDIVIEDEQVIDRPMTLNGGGYTITTTVSFESTPGQNSIIEIFDVDDVELFDFTLDGIGGTDVHGVNIYEATDVDIDSVTILNNDRSAVVVNSSKVTVQDITTSGNGFTGPIPNGYQVINVAKNTSEDAELKILSTSVHGESRDLKAHIYADDLSDVTFMDVDSQYERVTNPLIPDTAGAFVLKEVTDPEPERCVNLLENGSFEEPLVTDSKKWQPFATVAGWLIQKVSDNSATTLELHNGWSGNQAAEGDQYVELDGAHSTKISQTVATLDGGLYELKWAYAPRHNITAEQNQLSVMIDGIEIASTSPATGSAGLTPGDWSTGSYVFTADASTEVLFADAGPSNSFGTLFDDAQLCLLEEPTPKATVIATKIICEDESLLPNGGYSEIDDTTAADFLAGLAPEDADKCRLAEAGEFAFQVAAGGINTAGAPDNDGELTNPWMTAVATDANGVATVEITEDDLDGQNRISVREVADADYIPFTGNGGGNVSAELYCHTDAKNYDNLEWIKNAAVENTYFCVAWNVPEPKVSEVTMCKYDEFEAPLSGWQLALLGDEVATIAVQPDGSTQSIAAVPAGEYVLKAQGTYEYRGSTGLLADARFSERRVGDVDYVGPYLPWREARAVNGGLAVQVNNDLGVLWGSVYNPAHVYYGALSLVTASSVDFYVYDNAYSDNVGTIDVSLHAGRTGVTGEDGCVTFTDVPFGSYEVEELLQGDWMNLSGLGPVDITEPQTTLSVVNRDTTVVPVATIIAEKIVCTDESDLPNWNTGGTAPTVSSTTAANWVAEHNTCSLVEDWEFEWGSQGGGNPDNNLPDSPLYGTAGAGWTAFGPTDAAGQATVTLTADEIDGDSHVWVRERLQEGYIPFTFGPGNLTNEDNVTAEMYCHTDGKNYDNLDRVDGIAPGNTYHCVAFNAPVEPAADACTLTMTSGYDTVVRENNEFAVETYVHNAWTADIPGATWVWAADQVQNPENDEMYTFIETFTASSATEATLKVAADNGYRVLVNGIEVADRLANLNNFQTHTQKEYDVLSYLVNGENTLAIEVQNKGVAGSNYRTNPAGVLFELVVKAQEVVDCDITTDLEDLEPETYRLWGYKNEVVSSTTDPVRAAGWTIYASNGSTTLSTTTDANGEYYFDVEAGDWEVTEEDRPNWRLVDIYQSENGFSSVDETATSSCQFSVPVEEPEFSEPTFALQALSITDSAFLPRSQYRCDFTNEYSEPVVTTENEEEDEGGGTTTGTRTSRGSQSSTPTPQVAGAATSQCPFLVEYMQIRQPNTPLEVMKLQMFLNIFKDLFGGVENPVTGVFGPTTDANVKAFQQQFSSEILDPWFERGIVPHNKPTGFVYKTTLWKINSIVCPDTAILPEFAGEDLSKNVDID